MTSRAESNLQIKTIITGEARFSDFLVEHSASDGQGEMSGSRNRIYELGKQ